MEQKKFCLPRPMLAKFKLLRLVGLAMPYSIASPFRTTIPQIFLRICRTTQNFFHSMEMAARLVRRFVPKCTAVSAVSTVVTPFLLNSVTRSVLTTCHVHPSVCRSQDLLLLRLRLKKKTNLLVSVFGQTQLQFKRQNQISNGPCWNTPTRSIFFCMYEFVRNRLTLFN